MSPLRALAMLALLVPATFLGCGSEPGRAPGEELDGGSGGACATNDDCATDFICVRQVCTALDSDGGPAPDGGVVMTTDGGSACTTDTWASFAEPLIVAQCLSCHTHVHPFKDTYSSVYSNRSKMRRDTNSGAMPPRNVSQSLTTSERSRLVKWFDCGLPQ